MPLSALPLLSPQPTPLHVCPCSQDAIGSFAVGKQFDALLVEGAPGGSSSAYELFPGHSLEDAVETFINRGDDRHIRRVWVAGRAVAGTGVGGSGGQAAAAAGGT